MAEMNDATRAANDQAYRDWKRDCPAQNLTIPHAFRAGVEHGRTGCDAMSSRGPGGRDLSVRCLRIAQHGDNHMSLDGAYPVIWTNRALAAAVKEADGG